MKRALFLAGAAALTLAARPAAAGPMLRARVESLAARLPGAIGVCARTLSPGNPLLTYRAYERFPSASVIKLLVMLTAYVMEEQQPGTLEQRVTFRSSDLIAGSDFMQNADDRQSFTVNELIAPMIQVSDNTAANLLIGYFGVATINRVGALAGLQQTHLARKFLDWYAVIEHESNVSSPGDMAQLLYVIESGAHEGTSSVVSAASCRTMVKIMLGQTDRDGIPAALPAGVQVANKTGAIEGTRNDVAIVRPYGESPLIIAIMTKSYYDYSSAYNAIHAIARWIWHAAG